MAAGQKRVWRRNRERGILISLEPLLQQPFETLLSDNERLSTLKHLHQSLHGSFWLSCLKSPSILLKVCIIFIITSWPALINEGANGPKIIISLMFHIIQETQPSARTAIMPEESENCAQELWHLEFSFQKSFSKHFWENHCLIVYRSFHILNKFFQVFFDAFAGDVWPEERQITNDGQLGRGSWQKVSPISYKLQIANYKLQITNC